MSDENKKALERSTKNINSRYNANDSRYRRSGPTGDSLAYRIFASREEIDRMKNILLSSDMKTYEKNKEYIETVSEIFTQYTLIRESINEIYQIFKNAIENNEQMTESEIKDIILNGKKVPNLNYYINKDGYVTDVIVPRLKEIYDETVQSKIEYLDEKIQSLKQEVFERYIHNFKITDTFLSKSEYDMSNSLMSTKFVVDYNLSSNKENIGFEIYTDGMIGNVYRDDDYNNAINVFDSTFTLIPTETEINKNKPVVYQIQSATPIYIRALNDKVFNFIDIVIPYVLYEYDLEKSKGLFLTNNDSFNVFETKNNPENGDSDIYNIFKLNNDPYKKYSSITEPNEVVDLFVGNNNGGKVFLTTKTKDTVVKRNSIDNNPEFPFIIKSDKNQMGNISIINNRGTYKESDKNKYKTSQYKIGSENIDTIEMIDTYDTEVDVGNSGEIIDNLDIINKIPTDVTNIKNIDNGNTFVVEFSGSSTPPEWSEDSEGDSYDDLKWDTVHFVTNGRIRWRRDEVSTCARNSTGTYNITLNNGETYENCKLIREGDPCVLMRSLTMNTTDPNYELKNNLGLYDEGIFRLSSGELPPSVDKYDPTSQNNVVDYHYKWYNDDNYANLDKFITIGSKVPFSENLNGPMTEANYGYVTAIDLITQTMTIYNPATSSSKTICYKMFGDETKLKYVKLRNANGNLLNVTSIQVAEYIGEEVYRTNNDTTDIHSLSDFVFVDPEVQNADFLFGPGVNNNGNTDASKNSNYCLKTELNIVRRSHFSDNIYIEGAVNESAYAAISKFGDSGYIHPRYLFDASKIKGYMDGNYNYAKSYFITSVPDSYSGKGVLVRDHETKILSAYISNTSLKEVNKCLFLDGYYTLVENPENGAHVAAILRETNDKEFTFEYAHNASTKYKLKLSSQGTLVDPANVAYISTNNASVPIITTHEINGSMIIENGTNEVSIDFTYNNTKYKVNVPKSNIVYKSDIAIVTNKTSGVSVLRTSITDYLLGSDKTLNIKVGSTTHSNLNILKIGDAVLHVDPRYKFNQFMFEPIIIKTVSSSGISGVYYNSVKGTLTTTSVSNVPIAKLGIPYDSKTFYTSDYTTSKIVSINKNNRTVTFADGKTISYYAYSNTDMITYGYLYVGSTSKVVKSITQVDWNKFDIAYTNGTSAANVDRTGIIFNESLFLNFDYVLTDPTASKLLYTSDIDNRTLLKSEITGYRISYFNDYLIITNYKVENDKIIYFNSNSGQRINSLCRYKITDFELESIAGITYVGDASTSLENRKMYPIKPISGSIMRKNGECQLTMTTETSGQFTVHLTYAYASKDKWCIYNSGLYRYQSRNDSDAFFYTADGTGTSGVLSGWYDFTNEAAYVLDNTITGHIITEDELDKLLYNPTVGYVASFTDRDDGYLRWVLLSKITGESYDCQNLRNIGDANLTINYDDQSPYINKDSYDSFELYGEDKQYTGVIIRNFDYSDVQYSDNEYYYDMLVPGINTRVLKCKVLKRSGINGGYVSFGSTKCFFVENPGFNNKIICCYNEANAKNTQFPEGYYDEESVAKYNLDWLIQGDSHYFENENAYGSVYGNRTSRYKLTRQGITIIADNLAYIKTKNKDFGYDFMKVHNSTCYTSPVSNDVYYVPKNADITATTINGKTKYIYQLNAYYKYLYNQSNFNDEQFSNYDGNVHLIFFDRSQWASDNAK